MERSRSITIIFFLAAGLLISAAASPAFAKNTMRITMKENIVSVYTAENLLLRYRYENVPFKPCAQQLFSPGGVNVLRDAPADHLHHHALMFAVKVNGVNFWEETQVAGRQVHKSFTDTRTDVKTDVENDKRFEMRRASFTELIDWINPSQELLLKERRTIEVSQGTDLGATVLTWQSRFEVPAGKKSATLTGSHYHGLGMRFVKSMDTGGRFTNADGKPGTVFRGDERLVRSTWCAYTAGADGKPVTVAMFDHPQNPRHPATWFTMTRPFAYLSATLNLHKEPLKVASGKPLVLRYAVALWDGRVETEQINQLYRRWSAKQCEPLEEKKMDIKITSSAFEEGGLIPPKYTCDGADISPPLQWEAVPEGTKSIALISDDPDAPMGTWVHWVLFNLPAETKELAENVPPDSTLPNGARQGTTDFGRVGYGGPCPPSGTHRYFFKIYALDTEVDLPAGADKSRLLKAMQGHILGQGQLIGKYKRQ